MTEPTANKVQTHLQPFVRGFLPAEAYNFHSYMGGTMGLSKAEAKRMARRFQQEIVWMNDLYQVNVSQASDFIHLSVKRRDKQPIHDWRDLQAIKDMIVGPEHEGLELYPAARRVVDTANQFHIWVLKNPQAVIPVGFPEGLQLTQDEARDGTPGAALAVQRPFVDAVDGPDATFAPPAPLPAAIDALARIEALLASGAANGEIVLAIAREGLGKVDTSPAEAA